jgi:thiamine-phosphate diphosphorylase
MDILEPSGSSLLLSRSLSRPAPMTSPDSPRLLSYMITGDAASACLLDQIEHALDRGVDYVQLRRRTRSTRELEALAFAVAARFAGARDRILVNDHFEVALVAGLGGVHLPANGLPVASVLPFVPKGFLVARSTHDRDEAMRAAAEGASFVVYGPVFATSSKPGHPGVGLDSLADVAAAASVPVLALGGILPERVDLIRASGAAGVAGISSFEDDERLERLVARLRSARASR